MKDPIGNYSDKHPKGAIPAIAVSQAVQKNSDAQGISCAAAHRIVTELGVPPEDVGVAIDLKEIRINTCQLGLFGYGSRRKAVKPAAKVAPDLKSAIEGALLKGRLSCAEAWRIADAMGILRIEVANSCETLNIKINKCQLGAF